MGTRPTVSQYILAGKRKRTELWGGSQEEPKKQPRTPIRRIQTGWIEKEKKQVHSQSGLKRSREEKKGKKIGGWWGKRRRRTGDNLVKRTLKNPEKREGPP